MMAKFNKTDGSEKIKKVHASEKHSIPNNLHNCTSMCLLMLFSILSINAKSSINK